MTGMTPELQQLLDELARFHPADAAEILADLPSEQRAIVMARLGQERSAAMTAQDTHRAPGLSSWLIGLQAADAALTADTREALMRHIQAGSADMEAAGDLFARVATMFGRWMSGVTVREPRT